MHKKRTAALTQADGGEKRPRSQSRGRHLRLFCHFGVTNLHVSTKQGFEGAFAREMKYV